MKATDITTEIADIDKILADPNHVPYMQLYALRKLRKRLSRELKAQQLHSKAPHVRQHTAKQLSLI